MNVSAYMRRRPVPSAFAILGIALAISLLLYFKQDLTTRLRPGDTITLQFAQNEQIDPNETPVKIAGSEIGRVQSVEQPEAGPVAVVVKVDHKVRDLLGSEPTALLRPTTLLGGRYYIELRSGGQKGRFDQDTIPVERTTMPVELDKVLAAIPPDAQQGLQGMTERLDATFKSGAGTDLRKLLKDAPDTLRPAGVVLDGLRGLNKDTDLATLSTTANSTAHVLTATPGQLSSIVDSLAGTSKALGDNSAALSRTIADLPGTLRATRTGATDLGVTLDKLTDTADDARPIAKELKPTLDKLDPALTKLRPVAKDLGPLLADARPAVDELVPTVDRGTDVLAGAEGKPLDRVNKTILPELNREWKGEEPKYPNGGRDGAKFYQEFAYLLTSLNGMSQYYTPSTHIIGFQFLTGGPRMVKGTTPEVEAFQDLIGGKGFGLPHQGPNGGSKNPPLIPGTGEGFGIPTPRSSSPAPTVDTHGLLPGKGPTG